MGRISFALLVLLDASASSRDLEPKRCSLLYSIPVEGKSLYCAAFSPSGGMLAVGCQDESVRLYETGTWRQLCRLDGHQGGARSLAWNPEGSILAAGDDSTGKITFWSVPRGREVKSLPGSGNGVVDLAFSPDGKSLIVEYSAGHAAVWDVDRAERRFGLKTGTHGFRAAWSRDGKRVATDSENGGIRIWRTDLWQEEKTLPRRTKGFLPLLFTRDGRRLAASGPGMTVELWDVEKAEVVRTFRHEGRVYRLGFTPGERYLVSAGEGAVKVWEVATGNELARFSDHEGNVSGLAVHPSGRLFATAGMDQRLLVFGPKRGALTAPQAAAVGAPGTAFIGISGGDAPDGGGMVIGTVYENSAAEKFGLKVEDVIVEFKGVAIGGFSDLVNEVLKCGEGEEVKLKIRRAGELEEHKIKLGKRP